MKKTQSVLLASPDYQKFIVDLKARALSDGISLARAANRDLILLYWDIGGGIIDHNDRRPILRQPVAEFNSEEKRPEAACEFPESTIVEFVRQLVAKIASPHRATNCSSI